MKIDVQKIYDYCKQAVQSHEECLRKSLELIDKENFTISEIKAVTFLEEQVAMYKFTIPGIIKYLLSEGAAVETPLSALGLTVRPYNILMRNKITTVEDLQEKTENELRRLRNMGKHSMEEIKTALAKWEGK